MNNINPAFKAILDKLPPALHELVLPTLEEWDKGVQDQFAKIHQEYEPLKAFQPFVENNITPDFAWQSVVFADELQRDPAKVAAEINSQWDLGLIPKEQHEAALAQAKPDSSNSDDGDLFTNDDGTKIDLSKVPEFVQMQKALEAIQGSEEEKRTKAEQEAAIEEFEQELDTLEKTTVEAGKPFNKLFVTALMNQGLSGEDAVKQYHEVLAGTVTTDDTNNNNPGSTDAPPITMGNGGTVGSGQGDGAVDWANMPTSDFNANVAKVLEAAQKEN